jgi:site-specific DNA-methyltransferase (adenine-specific)
MHEAYRVLKPDRVAIMFYSWTKVDTFFAAWKSAGFRPVGHIVFRKTYASKTGFFSYRHEQAYLLAKGRPSLPAQPIADVIDMPYTGNKLHPTQKAVQARSAGSQLYPSGGTDSRSLCGQRQHLRRSHALRSSISRL